MRNVSERMRSSMKHLLIMKSLPLPLPLSRALHVLGRVGWRLRPSVRMHLRPASVRTLHDGPRLLFSNNNFIRCRFGLLLSFTRLLETSHNVKLIAREITPKPNDNGAARRGAAAPTAAAADSLARTDDVTSMKKNREKSPSTTQRLPG